MDANLLTPEAAAALVACAVAGMAGARFGLALPPVRGGALYAAAGVIGIAAGALALSGFFAFF